MSKVTFENYGRLATSGISNTEISGRYKSQAIAERRVFSDVAQKLQLDAEDDLLEIGCGVGTLLVPLSFMVGSATGIDHPDLVDSISRLHAGANIATERGDFFDIQFDKETTFSKILIYSVLHCLTDKDEAFAFIEKAFSLLRPGGRMLIGDLPNTDRKLRFQISNEGVEFEQAWRHQQVATTSLTKEMELLSSDPEVLVPDDVFIAELFLALHQNGANVYLVPQPPNLPFGHTREDIIVEKFA
jgi:2-polyprenyl-3-methyl-5-hydroxy-6-metoxy-1,4-benzoquinol methylase